MNIKQYKQYSSFYNVLYLNINTELNIFHKKKNCRVLIEILILNSKTKYIYIHTKKLENPHLK